MNEYEKFFTEKKVLYNNLKQELRNNKQFLKDRKKYKELLTEARDIVNTVMMATQKQVKGFIEEMITLVLQSVYGDEYRAELEYEIKRNKSEATCYVIKGENKRLLKSDVGGGVIDIYSFAMRIVLWALLKEKTNPTFWLDEPFKNVGKGKMPQASEIVKTLSEEFGIQFIINTHDDGLIEQADKAFEVKQIKKDESIVEEL